MGALVGLPRRARLGTAARKVAEAEMGDTQERGAEHGLIQGWATRAGKATWAMAKALLTKMPAGMVVASPLLADSPHRPTSTWVQCIRRTRRTPIAAARRTSEACRHEPMAGSICVSASELAVDAV